MISIIVAVSQNDVIGKEGDLPWHLPAELGRFKQITMGHPLVMGRKTYESIGRPLPGRTNIVLTRDKTFQPDGVLVVHTVVAALAKAKSSKGGEEIFFIGGASIYQQILTRTDKIYLTRVHTTVDGDKYFRFDPHGWRRLTAEGHPKDERHKYSFVFEQWVRV